MTVSGPEIPGSPPPEVPEEFAAAYRAAYERALAAQTGGPQHRDYPDDEPEDEPDRDPDREPSADGDSGEEEDTLETPLPRRRGPLRIGTHRSEEDYVDDDSPTWIERVEDSTWFVPLLLALLALLLVLGAYAVGRRFAGEVQNDASSGSEPSVVIEEGGSDKANQPVTSQEPRPDAWEGKITPLRDVEAGVGCTSPPGVDASGDQVSYDAKNLTDGAADTTWRCDGTAVGETITFDLGEKLPIGEVGLIPGYAKTDERSKADRFAENNRVTRVRWTIGDTEVVQKLSGSATDRNLQLVRVPRTTTDTVKLEILAVQKGPRNTTAISEVHLGKAGS